MTSPIENQQQRAELHKTIWRIANDLRGSVDGWDFKAYVLGMLFYRFISENIEEYVNTWQKEAGVADFDYATMPDDQAINAKDLLVAEKGFFILPSQLFQNVRKHAEADENLNETLEQAFKAIEGSAMGTESESDLRGLFDDIDVNSNRLGSSVARRNQKLVKLLNSIGDLPLGKVQDNDIDLFGDAYEYLMGMYASTAGKSGGEYYTPQEVSELLAQITLGGSPHRKIRRVYDPAVGSGSLLLKFQKLSGDGAENIEYFGQEINLTTYNLARINMFLHNVNFSRFNIALGDTLTEPAHWDNQPFDAIVSNPPYSVKWDGDSNPLLINDQRFAPAGVLAPKSKADLAFTMHMLSWLDTSGTAAIVEFPGVLYRGGAEQKIRKYLIDGNFIDTVIQLPPDLFFGTTIGTCIIVLKKSKQDNSVLFIDASKEFVRDGNKNKLDESHRQRILDAYSDRSPIKHFAELISNDKLADNDYNLSITSWVEPEDTTEKIDIDELNQEISKIVQRQQKLRTEINSLIKGLEN